MDYKITSSAPERDHLDLGSHESPSPGGGIGVLGLAAFLAGRRDVVRYHTGGPDENNYRRSGPWPQDPPTRPWIIMLQDRQGRYASLLFDLDDHAGDPTGDAQALCSLLKQAGMRFLIARSGPRRRYHVFAPFRPGVPPELSSALGAALRKVVPSLDTAPLSNKSSAGARPPGSPHRHGGYSRLLDDHEDVWEAMAHPNRPAQAVGLLAALGGDASSFAHLHHNEVRLAGLSEAMANVIRTGQKHHGDLTPSGVVFSSLLAMKNAGFTEDQAFAAANDPGHALRACLKNGADRHRRTLREHFDCEWEEVSTYWYLHPKITGPNDARLAISVIRQRAYRCRWEGRSGGTDLVVLEAHWKVASRKGNLCYHLGVREIEELTGLSRSTIVASHERLRSDAWLQLVEKGPTYERVGKQTVPRPSLWRCAFPQSVHTSTRPPLRDAECAAYGKTVADTFHDAFVNLPNSARRVWACLAPWEALTMTTVTRVTGLSSSTAYRAKDILVKHGLAVFENGTIQVAWNIELDQVAVRRGTLGHTEELHARHVQERDQFEARLNGGAPWPNEMTVIDPITGEFLLVHVGLGAPRPPSESGVRTGVILTMTAA